jgi:D-alanyl-D-alanine dipeptidase
MKISATLLSLIFITLLSTSAAAKEVESTFIVAGLVDVATIDQTIRVDLVNSDPVKNFFRENYYDGLNKAYLQRGVVLKLATAQKILKDKHPSFSLQILDAARPRSVSRAMYEKMKGTKFEKYVAHPAKGSMHNYGIAVDITIVNGEGEELDMGISPFRRSTARIYWDYALKKLGKKLSNKQKKNRELLSNTMKQAGFIPLSFEWWHFKECQKTKRGKHIELLNSLYKKSIVFLYIKSEHATAKFKRKCLLDVATFI